MFKIVVQNSCLQESGPRKAPVSEAFLIKLQALRAATLIKRDSWEICKIFKNILFYWTSPLTVSDSFRFPVCNLKKRFPQRYFSVNFEKLLKTSFDKAPPDDVFLSASMNFTFFRTSLSWSIPKKLPNSRSSQQRCSMKISVLRNFMKVTGNTCARVSFLIKLQVLRFQFYLKRDSGTKNILLNY